MASVQAVSLVLALYVVSFQQAFGAAIPGLYGTGVLDDGSLAPGGSQDLHYSLVSSPSGAGIAYVPTQINGFWLPQGPTSKWIAPSSNGYQSYPLGRWTYRIAFDLKGLDASTASITGRGAADDKAEIRLNGEFVTNVSGLVGYGQFTITNGFVPRVNTLDFVVSNATPQSLTGLRVDSLSGTAMRDATWPVLSITVSQVNLCWQSRTGEMYQVQYRSELTTNAWVNLGDPVPGNGENICLQEPVTDTRRYYRLAVLP